MKTLIVSLSVLLVSMTASVQAADSKEAAKAPCCDKAKSACAGAKSGCSKDAAAKKMDLSQKGGSRLISSL
ncbi:MAG TPA: hypothetical protein DCM86_06380 [Verrucomicrobiales bacterium]|nr:hypothetical protein [Verrucomicrobiales bacterium]